MKDRDTNLATHRVCQNHFFPPLLGGTSDKDFHIWVKWLYSAMLLTVLSISRQGYCPVHSSPLFGDELKVLSFLDLTVSINKTIFIHSLCVANPE